MTEANGILIGRYRLIRKLGEGGMGAVWLAEHAELHTYFAMKVARGEYECIARGCLRAEAERMKELKDRRIPYLVDFFEADEYTVLVMEYVDGITLEEYIRRNAPLEEEEALKIMKELCDIVVFLHNCRPQIIYRDIKPVNFIISDENGLRLLDFGTALSETGASKNTDICGTRGYAAPEQMKKRGVRADADVYSMAAVYSYMLSAADPSKPPFHPVRGEEMGHVVSRASKKLIDACLAEDPSKRPENATVLMERLEKIDPGRGKVFNMLEEHLYQLMMWLQVAACSILLWLRYRDMPADEAEYVLYGIACISLLWSVIRDDMFQDAGFILQRSWNIVITEKACEGLHFR